MPNPPKKPKPWAKDLDPEAEERVLRAATKLPDPRTKFLEEDRIMFVQVLRDCGNIREAAETLGISPTAVRKAREMDKVFDQMYEDAMADFRDGLEGEARRRAQDGVAEPVFFKGQECGSVQKYSDRLMELMLKRHLPAEYRERHEVTGAGGGPLQVTIAAFGPDATDGAEPKNQVGVESEGTDIIDAEHTPAPETTVQNFEEKDCE